MMILDKISGQIRSTLSETTIKRVAEEDSPVVTPSVATPEKSLEAGIFNPVPTVSDSSPLKQDIPHDIDFSEEALADLPVMGGPESKPEPSETEDLPPGDDLPPGNDLPPSGDPEPSKTIIIDGTDDNDWVDIKENDNNYMINLKGGDDVTSVDNASGNTVQVNGSAGNDVVAIHSSSNNNTVTADLGDGYDAAWIANSSGNNVTVDLGNDNDGFGLYNTAENNNIRLIAGEGMDDLGLVEYSESDISDVKVNSDGTLTFKAGSNTITVDSSLENIVFENSKQDPSEWTRMTLNDFISRFGSSNPEPVPGPPIPGPIPKPNPEPIPGPPIPKPNPE